MANAITIARILLIIPFTAMFFIQSDWAMNSALAIFIIAALSDFLDGFVARKRGEVSALGAALDPIADKLLIGAAIILLVRNGVIRDAGVIGAIVILLREIFVGGLREALAARGETLPVTALAKYKTAAQLVAFTLLIAGAPGGIGNEALRPIANGFFWAAVVLTLWTGASYTVDAFRRLKA